MSSPAMSCAEAEPLLPLVADGAVDPDSDPVLFAHLAACPACQRAVAAHDLIGLAIRQAGPPPVRHPRLVLLPWAGLAAAAGLALAATLYLRAAGAGPADLPPVPVPPVAGLPPAPVPAVAVVPTPPAAVPEVVAVRRADGTTFYLVRQGDQWVAVDPAMLDGPNGAAGNAASGVQVRF